MKTKQASEKTIEPNCKNRTVFIGDNREVMLGLKKEEIEMLKYKCPQEIYDHD